ncbi:VOC family protein [Streptomyces sp. NPDC006314]|uniref:VOC family protein n=1 Tax=Streptomyces sp. NPDC006314 TaxID=3154475 RepID=UPI0033A636E4
MFLDHVTFALGDLDDAVERVEHSLGVRFETPTNTIPGITGRVAVLDSGFIEVMAVHDREEAQRAPFGQKFVDYVDSRGGGIFSVTLRTEEDLSSFKSGLPEGVRNCGPITTWVPQPDGTRINFSSLFFGQYHLTPWVIAYDGELPKVPGDLALRGICLNASDLQSEVDRYAELYRVPQDRITVGSREAVMELSDGFIRMRQGDPVGFSSVEIAGPGTTFSIGFSGSEIQVMRNSTGDHESNEPQTNGSA